MKRDNIDETGNKYGFLTVLKEGKRKGGRKTWVCKCECGKNSVVIAKDLRSGNTKSCGCRQRGGHGHVTHGLRHHPLYDTWCNIKTRCFNKNNKRYKDYGGRNIKMCKSWQCDFISFYSWALDNNWKPEKEIHRKNNNKGYFPYNCIWISEKVHYRLPTRSKRLIRINDESHFIKDWCKIYKINNATIYKRMKNFNWSLKKAITAPKTDSKSKPKT